MTESPSRTAHPNGVPPGQEHLAACNGRNAVAAVSFTAVIGADDVSMQRCREAHQRLAERFHWLTLVEHSLPCSTTLFVFLRPGSQLSDVLLRERDRSLLLIGTPYGNLGWPALAEDLRAPHGASSPALDGRWVAFAADTFGHWAVWTD